MRERVGRFLRVAFTLVLLLIFLFAALALLQKAVALYFETRGHGNAQTQVYTFTESARELVNPNRGFYYMHGFVISDEEADYREILASRFSHETDTVLSMIEVNLRNYRDRAISEQGLRALEELFDVLEAEKKQLIVRFLYDWDGENEKYEPDSIDIILEHMRQTGPVLREHSRQILTLQGLFIGNWGEMNGSRFLTDEDLRTLAEQLAEVTDESTFLAVRMPAQWRIITGLAEPGQVVRGDGTLASRLGLFNDGMLGSWSDYGTYGNQTKEQNGSFTYWNREQELAFQEELCRLVPIGGEVIIDNSYNDFENAKEDMAVMHVTYLNREYDSEVLEKWAAATVSEEGCFDGMDGLSYIERHLGYRLVLRKAAADYDFAGDRLTVKADLQNVGFAPVYRETQVRVVLYHEESGAFSSYVVEQDVRELSGGMESEEVLTLSADISLTGKPPGVYGIFLCLEDVYSGQRLLLGNEQDAEALGYRIGSVELASPEAFLEEYREEHLPEWLNSWLSALEGKDA